jgi:hypothetical protein
LRTKKLLVAAPVAVAVAAAAGAVVLVHPAGAAAGEPTLVAAYSFDEGLGRYSRDQTGHGHHAELRGATWTAGHGGTAGAAHFNGESARAVVPASTALDFPDGYTIEAWVRPDAEQSGWRSALLRERDGGLSYGLYANDDAGHPTASLNTGGNDENLAAPSGLPAGTWSHLAATYDPAAGTLTFYLDGAAVASTEVEGAPNTDGAGDLSIGGNSVWGEYFAGDIDDVRLWDGPVSAATVAQLRDTPVATPALDAVISAPAAATVGGTTVLSGRGRGAVTVTSLQFSLDGAPLGGPVSARGGAGSVVFDSTTVTPGQHTVAVTITTSTGATATSVPNVLTVAPVRTDLRGAWGFNDGGATGQLTIYDYSGHHNQGAGDDIGYTPAEVGTGIRQGGEVGLVRVPDADVLSPGGALTLSAWVKPLVNLSGLQPVVTKQSFAPHGPVEYGLYASRDNGVLTGVITTEDGTFTVEGPALTLNEGVRVALTYDGSALRLYVDGDEAASEPATGTVRNGTGEVLMVSGVDEANIWRTFRGVLDSVRVYDRALSGEELDSDSTPI